MALEIERKFLVTSDEWRTGCVGQRYCQGYLARGDGVTVRVRRAGLRAYLTIKGKPNGITRPEFEYQVPVEEAEAMLKDICDRPLIEKTRFKVTYEGVVREVDEFQGDNAGLIIAEVELDHPDQEFRRPPWIGEEVTGDPRFRRALCTPTAPRPASALAPASRHRPSDQVLTTSHFFQHDDRMTQVLQNRPAMLASWLVPDIR